MSDTSVPLIVRSEPQHDDVPHPVAVAAAGELLHSALGRRRRVGQALAHPNGFLKIPLPPLEPGQRLFLHLWSRRSSDSHIHDHRWSFASTVLFGALTNELFVETADDDPGELVRARQVASARYVPAGETFRITPDGTPSTGVRRASRTVHPAGASYTQEAAVLHRAMADDDTATLINRGPHRGRSARVLFRPGSAPDASQRFEVLSDIDRSRALRGVLERLQP